jgi:hypothetical protein
MTQAELILNHLIKFYIALDKEKPGIRRIRGFNLVAVRPTTFQLTNCCFRVAA